MSAIVPVESFGDLLKYLRKRAHLTQRDLAAAVGYTEAHLSRLENNERLPDLTTVAALFIPALDIKDDPAMMERLLKLAAQARDERAPSGVRIHQVTIAHSVEVDLGALEEIPAPPAHYVERSALVQRLSETLAAERTLVLCDMAGMGKTTVAASVARRFSGGPVFWHTLTEHVNTSAEAIIRQLALFLLSLGQEQVRPLVQPRADSAPMALDQQLLLLRAALANQPALLCIEDVHLLQAEESSLSLLRNLGATTSSSLLLTSRQELDLPFRQVDIGGLELDEARDLLSQFGVRLEAGMLERLLAKTDCNPMLLRLAASQLSDSRANIQSLLDHMEMHPQVASYLLNTILNDLPSATRWIASLLSVFRAPLDLYDDALVELIHKAGQRDLEPHLQNLRRRNLVENPRRAELHPLVRDFLYTSLAADVTQKKRLHRLAAEWHEYRGDKIVEAAHHWVRASELERAAEVLADQSETLFHRGLANAAVQVVEDALERANRKRGDVSSLRRRLLQARGDLLRGTFRAAEAESSYREALSLAQNLPAVRAEIVRNLAQALLQRGQTAEALRLCQSARADLSAADAVLHARLGTIEARAHLALSHYDDAERLAAESIVLVETFSESLPFVADDVRARCERTLGWISYTRHPEGDESLAHYGRALEYARRSGLRVVECATLSNTATAMLERGDVDGARRVYHEAIQGYRAIGDLYGEAGVLHNLGVLSANLEDYEAALVDFEKASEIERRIGDTEGLLSSEGARASLLMECGKVSDAHAVLEKALSDGRTSTDLWSIGTCLCLFAEAQMLHNDLPAARASADRVLSMPGIEGNARIRAWAQSDLAMIQVMMGERIDAQRRMESGPSDNLGFELTTRWRLVQCMVAFACNDLQLARATARKILDDVKPKKLKKLIHLAERLLTDPPPTVAELPRLLLVSG